MTFNVWEKKNADGKGSGTVDWTSLMDDEKRKLLKLLPDKLVEQTDGIHQGTAPTVLKIWRVRLLSIQYPR